MVNTGGLVGKNYGKVELSYILKPSVSGKDFVGGLVGNSIDGEVQSSYTVDSNVLGDEHTGNLLGYGSRESCFTVSNSDAPSIPERPDLIMSKRDHRIFYTVETNTLSTQLNGELYSCTVLPTQVQSLVNDDWDVEMTDKFRASLVSTT